MPPEFMAGLSAIVLAVTTGLRDPILWSTAVPGAGILFALPLLT